MNLQDWIDDQQALIEAIADDADMSRAEVVAVLAEVLA